MRCRKCKSGITKDAVNSLCGFCDGTAEFALKRLKMMIQAHLEKEVV